MNLIYRFFYWLQEVTRQRFFTATEKTPEELFLKLAEYYFYFTGKDGEASANFALRMCNIINYELEQELINGNQNQAV